MKGMPEIKRSPSGQGGPSREASVSDWRTTLVGIGIFCIIAAVFVGAMSKGAGGIAPKLLATAGSLILGISIVWTIINAVLSRLHRGCRKSLETRS